MNWFIFSQYELILQQNDCKFDDSKVAATDSGCVDVESGSESSLKKSVAEVGPVSVAIDASHSSFQSYAGGKTSVHWLKKSQFWWEIVF